MTPDSPTAGVVRLRDVARTFPTTPYLLTVTADMRTHCSVVIPDWDLPAGRLTVGAPSNWLDSEQAGHHAVTILWPPPDARGYSLIVDGTATTIARGPERQLAVAPVRAVLHRPVHVDRPGSACGSDCVQIIPS